MRAYSAFLSVAVLALPLSAGADAIYRYVEKDGTIIYTNVQPSGSKRAKTLKGTFTKAPAKNTPVVGRKRTPPELDPHITAAALRYRIPPALVRAIMHTESNFNPNALSHKGASGLMQLMPATATDMYVKDIFNERDNIEGGVRYLRVLANMFDGDMVKMVAAYNAGPEAVKRYGGKVPPTKKRRGTCARCSSSTTTTRSARRPSRAAPASPHPRMTTRAKGRGRRAPLMMSSSSSSPAVASCWPQAGSTRLSRSWSVPTSSIPAWRRRRTCWASATSSSACTTGRPSCTRCWYATTRWTRHCGSTWAWCT